MDPSSPSENKVTLREIAERAGVSRMTVSLALRKSPRIAAQTRKAIQKIATKLGYRPDPQVSQFMSRIRKNRVPDGGSRIAFITTGDDPNHWKDSYTERLYWSGARARCEEFGYTLEEHWLDDPAMPPWRLSRILYARGINGVLVAPLHRFLTNESSRSLVLDLKNFSAIEISDTFVTPTLCRALHDHYASMALLLRKLHGLGYRRVGLALHEHFDLTVDYKWRASYRIHQQVLGLTSIEPFIFRERDSRKLKAWVRENKVQAVVSATSLVATMLESEGLSIPGKIAYADLDLDPAAKKPLGTGIDQNSELLGAAAVDLLLSLMRRGDCGVPTNPYNVLVEGRWVAGASAPRIA